MVLNLALPDRRGSPDSLTRSRATTATRALAYPCFAASAARNVRKPSLAQTKAQKICPDPRHPDRSLLRQNAGMVSPSDVSLPANEYAPRLRSCQDRKPTSNCAPAPV